MSVKSGRLPSPGFLAVLLTYLGVVLFFAIAQLPMYMLPAILSPVYRRLLGQKPGGAKD